MSRAATLFAASADLVGACVAHPFVQGIASGALDRTAFAFYVGQDAFYLDAFARAYALALAKAPDRSARAAFHRLLTGALDELDLHRGYRERWGVDLEPEPAPVTSAYCDFLLRVAWSEPVGRIAAAMTPCMRLYAHLGRTLLPGTRPESPYRDWVETYADPAFEELASLLEALLDRLGDDEPETGRHYRRAMALELEFFEAAWATAGPAHD
jgi:thiaminase/transcriptional activator TenA